MRGHLSTSLDISNQLFETDGNDWSFNYDLNTTLEPKKKLGFEIMKRTQNKTNGKTSVTRSTNVKHAAFNTTN